MSISTRPNSLSLWYMTAHGNRKIVSTSNTTKRTAIRKYRTENRWSKASVGDATPHSYGASLVGVGLLGLRSDIAARPATGTIAAMTAKYRIGRYDAMDGFMSTSLAVRPRPRIAWLRSGRGGFCVPTPAKSNDATASFMLRPGGQNRPESRAP